MNKVTVSTTTPPLLRIKERNAKLRELGILPMFYKFEEFIKERDHYENILSRINEIPLSSA